MVLVVVHARACVVCVCVCGVCGVCVWRVVCVMCVACGVCVVCVVCGVWCVWCVLLNDHVGLAFGEIGKLINKLIVIDILGGRKLTMQV